jgi:hypothetical protein
MPIRWSLTVQIAVKTGHYICFWRFPSVVLLMIFKISWKSQVCEGIKRDSARTRKSLVEPGKSGNSGRTR